MPWSEKSVMSLRLEFVRLALKDDSNFTELCKRYEISRPTGYKWINRYKTMGESGLIDQSRTPLNSPTKTEKEIELLIVSMRKEHSSWGGRKLYDLLLQEGVINPPHPNTITDILKRNGLVDETTSKHHQPYIRFEHEHPNDLWQMDFKGHFHMDKGRCHPLTVLDDCSRFSLGIQACDKENEKTTKENLIPIFERYGLPNAMNMDNGTPWGTSSRLGYTQFAVWLMRLGIKVSFSRPHHPQTNGKLERFHRTLKGELLNHKTFIDLDDAQINLEQWRQMYNNKRPHMAINNEVPANRYTPSHRSYPHSLPDIEYAPDDNVIRVKGRGVGFISFKGTRYRVGGGFYGYDVAIRPTTEEQKYDVYFCAQKIKTIDLTHSEE
jgi:transposase InsO family protein